MRKLAFTCFVLLWFQLTYSQSDNNKTQPYRLLNELNTNSADAFPWLSHDGLRLYFTQEINEEEVLVMTSRTNLNEKFGQYNDIHLPQSGEILSVWLLRS